MAVKGNKGQDDLFVCPECGASLDEEAITLDALERLHKSGQVANMFVIEAQCPECATELEAEIDVKVVTSNEVFSVAEEVPFEMYADDVVTCDECGDPMDEEAPNCPTCGAEAERNDVLPVWFNQDHF